MSTLATLNVALNGDISGFLKAMKQAEGQSQQSSGVISSALQGIGDAAAFAGKAAVAGIGVVVGAVTTGVFAFQKWGKELDSIGDVLGTTADQSAALAVAIQGVGGDVDGITQQMARLASGLVDAKGKIGPTGDLMKSLGIKFQTANGQLLPTTDIITNIANKIAKMPDGLEKTRIMTQLFGKSGKDLSDTMTALANGGLDDALKKAKALGLAIGEDGVARSIEFDKSMETLKMSLQGVAVSIGNTVMPVLLPLIQKFAEFAVQVMPKVRAAIEDVFRWIQTNVGPILQNIIAGLQAVGNWIATNWSAITGKISGAFEDVRSALAPIWAGIQNFIQTAASQIASMISNIFGGIATFLQNHGEEIKAWLAGAWEKIQTIIQGVLGILNATIIPALQLIADFIAAHGQTIQDILSTAWGFIRDTIDGVLQAIQGIINIAMDIIKGNWDQAWTDLKTFVSNLWESIKTLWNNFWTGIGNILDTIIPGFTKAWHEFWEGVKKFFEGIIDGIRQDWLNLLELIKNVSSIPVPSEHAPPAQGSLPRHAMGGSLSAGEVTWAGELGPEPFVAATNGYMLSHADAMDALRGQSGGLSISIAPGAITVYSADDPVSTAREVLDQLGRLTDARIRSK